MLDLLRRLWEDGVLMTQRDQATGRYTDAKLSKLCVCGHTLGEHAAEKVGTVQECFHADCLCECFRKAKEKR